MKIRLALLKVFAKDVVPGSPPQFNMTERYPSIIVGLGPGSMQLINKIFNILNDSLYYSSNGQLNMQTLSNTQFNFDHSKYANELKYIIQLSKLIYKVLVTNNGVYYKSKIDKETLESKVNFIKNNQILSMTPSINSGSQLYNKVGGDLKVVISNLLTQIANSYT